MKPFFVSFPNISLQCHCQLHIQHLPKNSTFFSLSYKRRIFSFFQQQEWHFRNIPKRYIFSHSPKKGNFFFYNFSFYRGNFSILAFVLIDFFGQFQRLKATSFQQQYQFSTPRGGHASICILTFYYSSLCKVKLEEKNMLSSYLLSVSVYFSVSL